MPWPTPCRARGAAVWNDVRRGADCPEIDAYRQELHDAALTSGQQQADAEEPRGEEAMQQHGKVADREAGVAPDVQQSCPAAFGNSDIYGGAWINR